MSAVPASGSGNGVAPSNAAMVGYDPSMIMDQDVERLSAFVGPRGLRLLGRRVRQLGGSADQGLIQTLCAVGAHINRVCSMV